MAAVPLNRKRADKALAFFNRLKLPDVPGTPALADACGDWFRDLLCAFLASEDPHTKQRLVWELLCMVPKKNSKTTYVAALGLTALFMEDAPNRQMLIVAPSQNISQRCFEQAHGMISLDHRLDAIFKVRADIKSITRRKTGTALDVKTFDTSIVTGEIPILTIIDELHELGKKAKAAAVMQQIRGGGITMQGGQVLMITTQSDEPPAGIWRTELEKARKIRDGKGGGSPILLPILYEFPEEQQRDQAFWRKVENWKYLLPNLGRSIDPQRLQDDYENNGRATAQAEQIWASQHLNIQIGVGLGDQAWRAVDYWSDAADPTLTLQSLIARCEVATIGFDIGGLDDLFGLAVIGREKGTRHWLVWNKAWAVRTILELRKDIAPRLLDFEREGSLEFVEKSSQLAPRVVDVVEQVSRAGLLPEKDAFAFDPNNIGAIVEEMSGRDFGDAMLRRLLTQGPALSPAIYMLPMKLADGTLRHAGLALMDFCVGNAKIEMVGNGLKMTKQLAGSGKIDPVIATLCAAMIMSWNPEASGRSFWAAA